MQIFLHSRYGDECSFQQGPETREFINVFCENNTNLENIQASMGFMKLIQEVRKFTESAIHE